MSLLGPVVGKCQQYIPDSWDNSRGRIHFLLRWQGNLGEPSPLIHESTSSRWIRDTPFGADFWYPMRPDPGLPCSSASIFRTVFGCRRMYTAVSLTLIQR
ncbi:hypothetical protein RERY_24290 [Rhodococcus erythropolis]|jgi:hypothetical protein|nr:hypothetical protein RERY_24290 [Rhodococcus erythropolis]